MEASEKSDRLMEAAVRDSEAPEFAELRLALAAVGEQLARGEYIELLDKVARRNYFDNLKRRGTT